MERESERGADATTEALWPPVTPRTKRTWDLGFNNKQSALTVIDTVSSETLAKLPACEVQRQAVIFELISTEENYNKDLDVVRRVFLAPIRERQLLTKEEITQLFANIEPIIELNKEFLKELKELQHREPVITSIGPLLRRWVDKFVVYLVYCSNHSYITERLRQFKAIYPSFVQFTEDCFVLPECRLLYLDSFLIAPLQRICKYPLLFKELDKHTDEAHPDHQAVQEASRAMTSLLMLINERTRQAENIDKMILVNSKLEFKEGESVELITAKRIFIRDGTFNVTINAHRVLLKEVQVYLFNDIMLITKKSRKNNKDSLFQVRNKIPLNAVLVRTQKDVPHLKDNVFEVVHMGDVVYTFEPTTQSAEEVRSWVAELTKLAAVALEAAVQVHKNRQPLLEEVERSDHFSVGVSQPPAVGLHPQAAALSAPKRKSSLLNFFLSSIGGESDLPSPSKAASTRPKSGGGLSPHATTTNNSGSASPDSSSTFSLRGAKEVLRESLQTERRLRLEAQDKATQLGTELERLKKKYRSLKKEQKSQRSTLATAPDREPSSAIPKPASQVKPSHDGGGSTAAKRAELVEMAQLRGHVKELRMERTAIERDLRHQQADNHHLAIQLEALEERAEMQQKLLALYSQQVASLMMVTSSLSRSSTSTSPSSSTYQAVPRPASDPPLLSEAALSLLASYLAPSSPPQPSSPSHSSPSSPHTSPHSSPTAHRRSTIITSGSPYYTASPPRRRSTSSLQRLKARQVQAEGASSAATSSSSSSHRSILVTQQSAGPGPLTIG